MLVLESIALTVIILLLVWAARAAYRSWAARQAAVDFEPHEAKHDQTGVASTWVMDLGAIQEPQPDTVTWVGPAVPAWEPEPEPLPEVLRLTPREVEQLEQALDTQEMPAVRLKPPASWTATNVWQGMSPAELAQHLLDQQTGERDE